MKTREGSDHTDTGSSVHRLLDRLCAGDDGAAADLGRMLEGPLRKLAADWPGTILDPRALIDQAYVILVGPADDPRRRVQFFASAAPAMRRVLVELAAEQEAASSGAAPSIRIRQEGNAFASGAQLDILELDRALAELAELNEAQARLAELRVFAGLTPAEAASCCGSSADALTDDWTMATAWVKRRLRRPGPSRPGVVPARRHDGGPTSAAARPSARSSDELDGDTVTMPAGGGNTYGALDRHPIEKLKALLALSRSLAGTVELEQLLPKLLDTMLTVLFPFADRGCILLLDERTERMVPAVERRADRTDGVDIREAEVQLSQTVLRKVVEEKQGLLSSNAVVDPRLAASQSIPELTIHSMICAPMLSLQGEPIGIIQIDTISDSHRFTADDMDLLMAIAGQTALSYDIARQLLKRQRLKTEMEIERHRSLAEMVAGLAHEINTPLGIVNSAASVVSGLVSDERMAVLAEDEDSRELLEDLAECAELIQSNIARADVLIQSFKKLSVRQLSESREEVDLLALVEEVVRLFAIQARENDLRVEVVNGLGDDHQWSGYPGFLSQVLLNLLTNAQRYAYPTERAGRVVIELRTEGSAAEWRYIVRVRDFGRGIPAADRSRIFEPFFTTGRDRGGSGLGLAIVHNLVTNSLHGTITVDEEEERGAIFTVTLPRRVPTSPDRHVAKRA